jgi:hypothetical protein
MDLVPRAPAGVTEAASPPRLVEAVLLAGYFRCVGQKPVCRGGFAASDQLSLKKLRIPSGAALRADFFHVVYAYLFWNLQNPDLS